MDILRMYKIGLVFYFILFVLIGWGATGSPNPLKFFGIDNIFIKIVLTVFIILMFTQLLLIAILSKIPEDTDCQDPDCGKSIRTYYLVLGGAIRCPKCGRWYHKSCWVRSCGKLTLSSLTQGCRICREEEEESTRRLFPEEDIFGQRW